MSEKSIFSKIIDREIPAEIEHEDEHCIVIHDIDKQAPVHLLIIPKTPVPRISESTDEQQMLLGHLLRVAAEVSQKLDLEEGFRVVINNGRHGCESIPHLHVHLLGGRQLDWPPG
ncbi:MAG: histidine triad nucleotide-binding protein [Opitutales bacterium]|nr:histidine triad nucleotide-binding protein [Opitutales bacterium]